MEFPTKIVLLALLVNGFGGLFKGFGIGYVSIYMTYNTMNANCSALHSEEACNSVKHADCKWASARNGSGSLCLFGDYDQGLCEDIEGGEHACRLASQCYYDQDSKLCKHVAGWSATQSGIFAGAMTVGAMGGSFAAGPILDTIGRRRTLTVIGLIGFLSTALIMVGRAVDNFALLVFCRAFSGVGIGGTNVACPMYVKETVPERFQGPLGVTFSVFLTFGILWASLMGLVMAPTDFSRDLNMEARFQAMNVWLLLITAVLFVVGCCIPESPHFVTVRRKAGSLHAVEDSTATEVTAETKGLIAKTGSIQDHEKSQAQKPSAVASLRPMLLPLTVATVLSAAQQLTGMMAIMNYAPSITKASWSQATRGQLCGHALERHYDHRLHFYSKTVLESHHVPHSVHDRLPVLPPHGNSCVSRGGVGRHPAHPCRPWHCDLRGCICYRHGPPIFLARHGNIPQQLPQQRLLLHERLSVRLCPDHHGLLPDRC